MAPSVTDVFIAALVTALATGLGAAPFLFSRNDVSRWNGMGNALASGLMAAATALLFWEGAAWSIPRTILGAFLGWGFIAVLERILRRDRSVHIGDLNGADVRKALLIMGVMTAHSLTEGIGVGVSFGGGDNLGAVISAAIAVHNIPEGLAISLVLVPRGFSVGKAALWSIGSSLPQPLMAVPAFLFVAWFAPLLPIGLGFAGGAMVWVVFRELLPDAQTQLSERATLLYAAVAFSLMMIFQLWLSL